MTGCKHSGEHLGSRFNW